MTKLEGNEVLTTGASRGIGRALVDDAFRRGAERVYAAMRIPMPHPDKRVTTPTRDVTDVEAHGRRLANRRGERGASEFAAIAKAIRTASPTR